MDTIENIKVQLELAAFNEKIFLAKLEQAKAAERTAELEYEATRFQMQLLELQAKHLEARQGTAVVPTTNKAILPFCDNLPDGAEANVKDDRASARPGPQAPIVNP